MRSTTAPGPISRPVAHLMTASHRPRYQATRSSQLARPAYLSGARTHRQLELSLRWSNRCLSACPMVLIAVQDGMTETDLEHLVGRKVGIFLGGSTAWKLATMARWGSFCARRGVYYHVARVNTERRTWMAVAAGADSIDGSSASRYAVTLPMLDRAAKQTDLHALELKCRCQQKLTTTSFANAAII